MGSLLSANAIQAAPAGLLAATAAAVKGTAVGASTLALVAGTLKSMAWAKVKLAIGWGTGLLLVGGGAVLLFLAGAPSPSKQATGVVYLEGTSTRHLFDDQGNELPLAIKDEQGNVLKPGDTVDFSLWLSGCRWVVRFDSHLGLPGSDRKSTRLNSSHLGISYAVFCLKKNIFICLAPRAQSTAEPSEALSLRPHAF